MTGVQTCALPICITPSYILLKLPITHTIIVVVAIVARCLQIPSPGAEQSEATPRRGANNAPSSPSADVYNSTDSDQFSRGFGSCGVQLVAHVWIELARLQAVAANAAAAASEQPSP